MILKNLPSELDPNTTAYSTWEKVTSQHIIDYYEKVSDYYGWIITITEVKTTLRDQKVLRRIALNDEDMDITPKQDQPEDAPPAILTETPGTVKVELTYDQEVTYYNKPANITDEELSKRLFVLPFETDSFHYAMALHREMDWSTWVIVETVKPSPPTPEPVPIIASRLTRPQTLAISGSIIIAAFVLVSFLLYERNAKVNANAALNRSGEDVSTVNAGIQGSQGTPIRVSESGGLPWNQLYYNNGNGTNNYDTTADETYLSSVRSAPGHLRRNQIERERQRERSNSRDSIEGGRGRVGSMSSKENVTNSSRAKYGTMRSAQSRSSSNSSNADNNQEISPRIGSPGIPQQIPFGSSAPSSTNRNNSNKPFLPPLPPAERRRTMDSTDSATSSNVPLNDANSSNNESFIRPASNRRQSGRAFGMRLSDGSMDFPIVADFVIPNPPERGHMSYASSLSQSIPFPSTRSRSEPFTSPLHIPDEENILSVEPPALLTPRSESPIPTTMLGLESRSIDDPLTPAQSGFAMTVSEDLER